MSSQPTSRAASHPDRVAVSESTIVIKNGDRQTELGKATTERILSLLREHKKIEAIKILREESGLDLRESKALVDALEKAL